ncbi:TRAP transporter small permease subunit [Alphaproteobacteria bacterium KMM 3653]|uniref:TRAP transporter small permease protein n=1 Tax=Harenicola maris TaxID=2841044 RepID=A0AAP2CN05_9RHOB|nr:TRAP transporter small permease subunit [Harenicola maris]
MGVLLGLLAPIRVFNDAVLAMGRGLAILALALMVLVVLAQVFFRYVVGNALPWPDELARFMMLWMTGLIAPSAYRTGGFVAIDMLGQALGRRAAAALSMVLLVIALLVLVYVLPFGLKHISSGCLFKSSTLWLPFTFEFSVPLPGDAQLTLCTKAAWAFNLSFGWTKMPLAISYAAIAVGVILLIIVNVELILRNTIAILGGGDRLPAIKGGEVVGAD